MPSPETKSYIFDNPKNVQLVMRGLYVLCALLVIFDLVVHRHTLHPWEHLYAFYPIYGFVSCVLLVLLAKVMRRVLMRPDDYYDSVELRHLNESDPSVESADVDH